MELDVGAILDGKVTGITKFGAFVALPGGRSGLVHISEIAYSYVNDVSEHLAEGQEVKVKIIGIDDAGRINLSIKKAMDPPPRPAPQSRPQTGSGDRRPPYSPRPNNNGGGYAPRQNNGGGGYAPRQNNGGYPPRQSGGYAPRQPAAPKEPATFEDKLKQFMQASDTKLSDMRAAEKRGSRRGGSRK